MDSTALLPGRKEPLIITQSAEDRRRRMISSRRATFREDGNRLYLVRHPAIECHVLAFLNMVVLPLESVRK